MELKICGLGRLADIRVAEVAGADYVGMIVEVERSPRKVSVDVARRLAQATDARVVAVIADETVARAAEIARQIGVAALQLHGSEGPQYLRSLSDALALAGCAGVELWKAASVPPCAEAEQAKRIVTDAVRDIAELAEAGAARIVLDTSVRGHSGGTGQTCDWAVAAQIVAGSALPVVLAGGIGPGNVAAAIAAVSPAGVDVSSGVERCPGVKSPLLIQDLARALREATATRQR
jgi:phosphoribosylanthranilate isomerase